MAHSRSAEGVYSQGQLMPIPQNTMVQATAGYGEYDGAGFTPLAPYGSLAASPDGIGAYARSAPGVYQPGAQNGGSLGALGSPLLNAIKTLSGGRALGDDAASAAPVAAASGLLIAAVVVGLAVTGASGYYVGKAVAPSHDKQSKYAWWGVFAALVGGPVGLGIESAVALSHGRG